MKSLKSSKETDVELILCADKSDLADKAARSFARIITEALNRKTRVNVALSGGSTPLLLYERLLKEDLACSIPWSKIAFFVSDERCVPQESPESNFGNAFRHLFLPLNLDTSHLYPAAGDSEEPALAASRYEELIRKLVAADEGKKIPSFDLIFLGMGADGHTASLFPGTEALGEKMRLVSANYVEKLKSNRITFTLPLLNNANHVIFLVAGKDKADVLEEVMENKGDVFPCQLVKPASGRLSWFVDKDAAAKLAL